MFAWLNKLVRKSSKGERLLVTMLPSWGWVPFNSWATNRHELMGHMKGWQYVPISVIANCMGKAGAKVQVAYVEDADEVGKGRKKAMNCVNHSRRLKRLARFQARYVPRLQRQKAMAHLQEGDELVPVESDHRLLKLLRNPNQPDTAWTHNYKIGMFLRLGGGVYEWEVPGNDGLPIESWALPPNWMWPIGGKDKLFEAYECRPVLGAFAGTDLGFGWFSGGGTGRRIPAEEIIQIGYPHPQHFLDFYSPVTAAAEWIQGAENVDQTRIARFQNSAYPGVILEVDKDVSDPDNDMIERIKKRFQTAFAGPRKVGDTIVLGPGIKANKVSDTPLELDLVNGGKQLADWNMALHGVGASMTGMAEQTTMASMISSRFQFYNDVIDPMLTLVGQVKTEKLAHRFDSRLCVYWPEQAPSDPQQTNEDIKTDYACQAISPDEIRAIRGREAWSHGGKNPMAPMGISEIPLETGEESIDLPISAMAAKKPQGSSGMGGDGTDTNPGNDGAAEGGGLNRMRQAFAAAKHLYTNGNGVKK